MDIFIGSIVIFIIFGGMGYIAQVFTKKRNDTWRALAEDNNLTFETGNFFTGRLPRIFGEYEGHQIELDTCYEDDVTYARITLHANETSPKSYPEQYKTDWHNANANTITTFLISKGLPNTSFILEAEAYGQKVSYKERGYLTETSLLYMCGLLVDLAHNYPIIVAIGGEIVPALEEIALDNKHHLQRIAICLLKDIAESSTQRLSYKTTQLLCPECFAYCDAHQVRLSWAQTITYYGCRECKQSRKFAEGQVIAVLDSQMTTKLAQKKGQVEVNWLIHRNLFDFEKIEIRQASDENVERFVVQVGNDTAPWRKPHYRRMQCVISPNCRLSDNTIRILDEMFEVTEPSNF